MNPLRTLRDWWHRPVTDRLDAIASKLHGPQIGQLSVDVQDIADAQNALAKASFKAYRRRSDAQRLKVT